MSGEFYTYAQAIEIIQSTDGRQLIVTNDNKKATRQDFLQTCTDIASYVRETQNPHLAFRERSAFGMASVQGDTNTDLIGFLTNDAFATRLAKFRYEIPRAVNTL